MPCMHACTDNSTQKTSIFMNTGIKFGLRNHLTQTLHANKQSLPTQESATEALAAAAAEDEDAWRDVARGAWPFQALCEQLCLDAVHPCWESRHGAAVALREVLRTHAPSAAVRAPLSSDQPSGCCRMCSCGTQCYASPL